MNAQKAAFILEVDFNTSAAELKRKFHMKALQYHPDKNKSEGANAMFQEVNEAYMFLSQPEDTSYEALVKIFTKNLDENEYMHKFLDKLLLLCEKQALEWITVAKDAKFLIAYKILIKYRHLFHLSPYFYEEMEKNKIYRFAQGELKKRRLAEMKMEPLKSIEIETEIEKDTDLLLRPSLDDLWDNNLYKYSKHNLYVPLWHHELVYELDSDFVVKVEPKLPTDIWMDDQNNLHQKQEYSLHELWDFASQEKCMHIYFGKKRFTFYPHELLLQREQEKKWCQQGISKRNETNIYDVSLKADVYLHIFIRNF